MSERLDEFLDDFRLESHDSLDQIESHVLEMEQGDPEAVNVVFRAMHSIKGGSSFLDLINVNRLSHQLENLLDLVREGKLSASRELSDILLRGTDILKFMIDSSDGGESEDLSDILTEVTGYLEHGVPPNSATTRPIVEQSGTVSVGSAAGIDTQPDVSVIQNEKQDLNDKGPFGQFLVERSYLSQDQVFNALIEQERRELSILSAFAEHGIGVSDCLRIANLARIHMLHPLRVAKELELVDESGIGDINKNIQNSRPPIGHILRDLNYCDEVEARIWLQEYYDYCNGVESDPELQQQLQEHRAQKALQVQVCATEADDQRPMVETAEEEKELRHPCGECEPLIGSTIECEDNLISDYQDYVCEELRTEIENTLLGFEKIGDRQEVEIETELKNMFRTMHSLKGSVGFINAIASQKVIHALEDTITLLQRAPSAVPALTWQLFINASLKGVDIVWGLRDTIITRRDERPFIEEYHDDIEVFFENLSAAKTQIATSIKVGVQNEDIDDLF